MLLECWKWQKVHVFKSKEVTDSHWQQTCSLYWSRPSARIPSSTSRACFLYSVCLRHLLASYLFNSMFSPKNQLQFTFTYHAGGINGCIVLGHQRVDELVEAIVCDIVQRSPARLRLAVHIRVLGKQHLADVRIARLCCQVQGGSGLLHIIVLWRISIFLWPFIFHVHPTWSKTSTRALTSRKIFTNSKCPLLAASSKGDHPDLKIATLRKEFDMQWCNKITFVSLFPH